MLKFSRRVVPSATAFLLAVIVLVGCQPAASLSPEVAHRTPSASDLLLGRLRLPAKAHRSTLANVAAAKPRSRLSNNVLG